jgi:hypothetical protein
VSFCEHCQGQRFDRARVLRALRQLQHDLGRRPGNAAAALAAALRAVRDLDIPHLDPVEDDENQVVH